VREAAEVGGVETLEGADAGEETVGGVAVGGEAGDGVVGDWTGDSLGVPALGDDAGAGAGEAELITPKTKTKQRIALNRPILSAGCCWRRILQIRVMTVTLWSRSVPEKLKQEVAQEEKKDLNRESESRQGVVKGGLDIIYR
jgi:hypothetical protein